LVWIFFGTGLACFAQGGSNDSDLTVIDSVQSAELVEELPVFPGGQRAMMMYIGENVRYPKKDRRDDKEGVAYIQFVIEKDGSVTNVQVRPGTESKATEAMIEEAIRVISGMPKWKPGTQQGKPVRVKYTIPIQFRLK